MIIIQIYNKTLLYFQLSKTGVLIKCSYFEVILQMN